MYEILEDGRVALDPTALNDRMALSLYAELLGHDNEMIGADRESELDKLFIHSSMPGTHTIYSTAFSGRVSLDKLASFLDEQGLQIIKMVVGDSESPWYNKEYDYVERG